MGYDPNILFAKKFRAPNTPKPTIGISLNVEIIRFFSENTFVRFVHGLMSQGYFGWSAGIQNERSSCWEHLDIKYKNFGGKNSDHIPLKTFTVSLDLTKTQTHN